MKTEASSREVHRYEQLIDGRWQPALSGATYARRSPRDGGDVELIPWSAHADAELAIRAARRAFDGGVWSRAPAAARAALLQRAAARLRERLPYFSELVTEEMGKPISTSRLEVQLTAEALELHAALALDLHGDSVAHHVPTALGFTLREPVGVVGVITPWNFPLLLSSWKLGPALAVGCAVVAKPSELAAGCILELARLLTECGLPPGVLNVITGPGEVVGRALTESPDVDKIAFTGSTAVGKAIMASASGTLKRLSLELGGKCPNIVFPDADLEAAIGGAIGGGFLNAGQVCMAGSRLLVHEAIKEPFLHALVGAVQGVKVGDPRGEDVLIGPLVHETQLARVLDHIEVAKAEGAKLLTGGRRVTAGDHARGLYVEPTIFGGVTPSMRIAREEVFGPVIAVQTFRDEREALELANDTSYGLAAAVWTRNVDTALRMAKGLQTGTVWVNGYHSVGMTNYLPFGGYKQSGVGREAGRQALDGYLETKSVHLRIGG